MKRLRSALVILLMTPAMIHGQGGIVGTWRAEGVGQGFPWTVVLRQDAQGVSGMVSSCASNFSVEIDEGTVDGNTLSFSCVNPARTRVITFNVRLSGDELSIAWAKQLQGSGPTTPDDAVFGDAAPRVFRARRIPDSELLAEERQLVSDTDQVRGLEFTAGANLLEKDVKVDGKFFLPEKTARVHDVLVVIRWGIGGDLYWDSQLRALARATASGILQAWITNIRTTGNGVTVNNNAAMGGAEGLTSLLQKLAQESGHPEVANAPLLFWGHSTAGPFGSSFAALHPERVIGFVRYHSGPVTNADLESIRHVPVLFFCGEKDSVVDQTGRHCTESVKELWASGRSVGAPWTFAIEPDATHGDLKDLAKANRLLIPWIAGVLRLRLSQNDLPLRALDDRAGWMANSQNGEVAPFDAFSGVPREGSWLPDEPSAQGWRLVTAPAK